jgi:hypothetical protein
MAQQQQQQAGHAANLQAEEEAAGTCQPISLLEVNAASAAVADQEWHNLLTEIHMIVLGGWNISRGYTEIAGRRIPLGAVYEL